jgi:hypothetical protein
VIDAEISSTRAIYIQYVAPLAAIGAIAGFIGRSIVGISIPFLGTYRTPFFSGLVMAVVMYALTLLSVFILALIIDALAPTFGGEKNFLRALKVSAYSYTPAWIAAVFQILPSLGVIGLLAGLYGLYLLYLGLPVLMRCPKDKAIAYTAVLCLCAIVLYVIIGMISSRVIGGAMMGSFGPNAAPPAARPPCCRAYSAARPMRTASASTIPCGPCKKWGSKPIRRRRRHAPTAAIPVRPEPKRSIWVPRSAPSARSSQAATRPSLSISTRSRQCCRIRFQA